LKNACGLLGFQNRVVGGALGLDKVNCFARTDNPEIWQENIKMIVEHFLEIEPSIVFFPHKDDGHPTHEGTHLLISEALALYTSEAEKEVLAVENEFWHPVSKPNLLVGLGENELAILISALVQHKGEVSRNPYHLWQPARMMDNVRRGWELVFGSQGKIPDFCFAELYRVSVFSNGEQLPWKGVRNVFGPDVKIDLINVANPVI